MRPRPAMTEILRTRDRGSYQIPGLNDFSLRKFSFTRHQMCHVNLLSINYALGMTCWALVGSDKTQIMDFGMTIHPNRPGIRGTRPVICRIEFFPGGNPFLPIPICPSSLVDLLSWRFLLCYDNWSLLTECGMLLAFWILKNCETSLSL